MVHGKGSGFVLAAVIGLIALAPAQAAAAGVKVPASAGRDTVTAPTRVGAAAFQGSTGTRRRTVPVVQRSTASAPARPAAARRVGLAAGVGTNVQVSPNNGGLFSETAVAIDPNDTTGKHVTAASNSLSTFGMPAYSSADGGATWSTSTLTGRGLAHDAFLSDPGVAYDLNGTLSGNPWFSFIGVDNVGQTELEVEHITDIARVSVPDTAINGPDKPMIAVDPRSNNGSVYVGYTQNPSNIDHQPLAVVASHDIGVTFSTPVQVWDSGGDIGAWPAVGADGTVYMVWDDYCGLDPATVDTQFCSKLDGQILVSKSTNGGATWSATPTRITDTTTGFGSILPNHATECTQGCPARPVNASPQVAIDRSGGARNGTIYVVYGDGSDRQLGASTVPSAHRMHVFLQESKDGGATWSSRIQLDTGNPNDAWQPSVAVDQSNGNVVVAWYDRRDDGSNHLYRPFFSESTADNGGGVAQFDAATPLADSQSDPAIDCNATGDYLQIAAAAGVAHPVWTDTRTGLPAIFTASVTETVTVPTPAPMPGSSAVRPVVGTGWLGLPGGGSDIGVGASCQAWIIGQNAVQGGGGTWFFNGTGWSPFTGGGVRITVHPAGFPRLVNDGGGIYRLLTTGWQNLPGLGTDIASGPDTSLWLIGADNITGGHGVYFFNGSGTFSFAGGGGVRIAVGPDGLPWVVNNVGAIWHLTANGWVNVPGAARDIGVGADGSVWVLGQNSITGGFQTYHYNGTGWDAVNGGGVAISVGPDGLPWVVNSSGRIFERV